METVLAVDMLKHLEILIGLDWIQFPTFLCGQQNCTWNWKKNVTETHRLKVNSHCDTALFIFDWRAFSDTTLVCFFVNEHTTKCSHYKNHLPVPCISSEALMIRIVYHLPHKQLETLNPLGPSYAYMCQWGKPSLVQIMACGLVGAKPLSEPVAGSLLIRNLGTNFIEILSKIHTFLFRTN